MTKEIVNIFVSHGSWKSEGKECLREAFDALERVVEEFNKVIDYRDHFEIRLSDFQKNPNATYQSLEELMKNADKFHAVFVLVEGQLSPAIKDWYIEKEKILKETKEEQRVPIPVFWDISNDSSANNFEEFCKENQKERNYIHSYRTPDERDEELRKTLKKYAVDWNQKIIKGEILPTMEENRRKAEEEENRRKAEEEEERRRHWHKVIRGFCGAVFFFAFILLFIHKLWPNFKTGSDSVVNIQPAFHSAGNEIALIDSLISVQPHILKVNPGDKDKGKGVNGSVGKAEQIIAEVKDPAGGTTSQITIETKYSGEYKLQNKLYYITYEAKDLQSQPINQRKNISGEFDMADDKAKALWNVSVTASARKHPAGSTSGYYFAYVDVFVTIKNTVNGKIVFDGAVQAPDGIKGGSKNSFEEAVNEAYKEANRLIVVLIKQKTDE